MKKSKYLGFVFVALYTLPARADDRDAFSSVPVPPNIAWLIDNSGSMDDFSCYDTAVSVAAQKCFRGADMRPVTESGSTICRSAFFDVRGYNKDTTYRFDPGVNETNADAANQAWTWATGEVWNANRPDGESSDYSSINDFCSATRFPNCWQRSRCRYSLKTFGYFGERFNSTDTVIGDDDDIDSEFNVCTAAGDPEGICSGTENSTGRRRTRRVRVTGNFIEFSPPKFAVARKVFREVNGVTWNPSTSSNSYADATKQRMALFNFNGNWGAKVRRDIGPACAQSYDQSLLNSERTAMVNAVDGFSFSTSTPLGESLDDIGCYFAAGDPPRACRGGDKEDGDGLDLSAKSNFYKGNTSKPQPICQSCQRNFAIVVTDGFPTNDGNENNSTSGGENSNDYPLMSLVDADHGKETSPAGVTTTGNPILPSVAKYLFLNDLDKSTTETENIITYAVSFGLVDSVDTSKCFGALERAANYGGGRCFPATDYDELKSALQAVLQAIDARNRAFTSPAIQTTRTQGQASVNLAVFKPHAQLPLWRGNLFGFRMWDETIDGDFSGGTSAKNEIFVLDKDNQPISFDAEGNLLSKPYWDAQLCLSGDLAGNRAGFVPEDPHGLDVTSCRRYADENDARKRNIFTKIDPATPGTPDPFTVGASNAQATLLQPLIGVTGVNRAAKIIKYFRGLDMLDQLGTGSVSSAADRNLSTFSQRDGWWKLGDIYHSTPTPVAQPLEFLGEAYGGQTMAYGKYSSDNQQRKRFIIAGSNDGMVHAFHAGEPTATSSRGLVNYDQGTGEELWAFVPPHQLPSYNNVLDCPDDAGTPCNIAVPASGTVFKYRVDGSPQVRDAYLPDSTANRGTMANLKDQAKSIYWRTLTVIGDRDGGTKYTALDVTDPANPRFLWEFPQASQIGSGTNQRAEPAGRSWSDTFPNPASIFPMKFADASAAEGWYFRWVVALPGGFDRNQKAGRGFYLVDAATGALVWKFENGMADASRAIFSFAGAPAGAPSTDRSSGPYVDRLVAVDTGGQMWAVDARAPAVLSGGMAQWTATRVFATMPDNTPVASNGDSTLALNEYPYRPFFHITALSYDEKANLWAYVGSGDRDLLANPNPSHLHGVTLHSDIRGWVCGNGSAYDAWRDGNRIYGVRVTDPPGSTVTRPLRETDLQDVTVGGSPGEVNPLAVVAPKPGWYLRLAAGEKVNNPIDVLQKYAYVTTYRPTGACDAVSASTAISCESPSGLGKLYTLNYLTGLPPTGYAMTGLALGNGVPTAPAVSVGMGQGRASAAMLISTSQDPTPKAVRANAKSNLVQRMVELVLPQSTHEKLRAYGSGH